MRINSTSCYLSQVLHTLKTSVIPAQTSETVSADLDWIGKIVEELLKRHGPTLQLLRDVINNGEQLEAEIHKYLGITPRTPLATIKDSAADFDALLEHHTALLKRLNDLTIRLLQNYSHGLSETAFSFARQVASWEMEYFNKSPQIQADPLLIDPGNMSTKPPLSKEYLQKFLSKREKGVEVVSFDRFTNGFGKQTYFATTHSPEQGTQEVVIRKSDATPVLSLEHFNIPQEYDLVRCVSSTGFPVPKPIDIAHSSDDLDGDFWIMEKRPGKMVSHYMDVDSAKIDDSFWPNIATLLAELHQIPLQHFKEHIDKYYGSELMTMDRTEVYRRKLKDMRQKVYDTGHQTSPTLSLLFAWCENNIPKDSRQAVVVHGDFNVHNMLGENGKITTILDWETATFGAPEQDLAFLRSNVSKHMDWDVFLQHYKAAGGLDINEELFGFYLGVQFLLMNLGLSNAQWNLQNGYNRDIRFVALEMGFIPYLFNAGIDCCRRMDISVPAAEAPDAAKIDETSNGQGVSQIEAFHAGVNGHGAKINGEVNGSSTMITKIFEKDGKRYTKTSDGRDLEVFGHQHNLRQKPTTQELYQESITLHYWDDENKVGGFHRLGHEPNLDGGKAVSWNYITSPQGIYKKQSHLPLREEDVTPTGGFGSGNDIVSFEVIAGVDPDGSDDRHVWTINDPEHELSLRFEHVDTGPSVDCFPKGGTMSENVTPFHLDIGGIGKGVLKIKTKTYNISALSFRDKGMGVRDWSQILSHRWVAGTCGPHLSFVALSFMTNNHQMATSGWVVRNGVITYTEALDIVTYVEIDGASNRGGHVRFTLTTGEILELEATPLVPETSLSFYKGTSCVDQLCSVYISPGHFTGMCDFETTNNLNGGNKRPKSTKRAVLDDGFHPV